MSGSYVNGGGNVSETPILRLTAGETQPLFGSESANVKSPIVVLGLGCSIMLSAFGMVTGEEIITNKLLLKHKDYPDGDGCSDEININPKSDIIAQEQVNCGGWKLSECKTVLFLSTPGTYQFALSDPAMLTRVLLQASSFNGHNSIDQLDIERGLA